MSEIRFPIGKPLVIPSESPKADREREQTSSTSFDSLLSREMSKDGVKLSAHAQARLRERGVDLTVDHMSKIEGAIDTLASKGGKDSLVLMGNTALIVSVPNRTVVTAMDSGSVFTNIDSAVIIN